MKKIKINNNIMTCALKQLFELLEYQCYFVGGVVRDLLMNKPVHDIDLATPLLPEDVCYRLKNSPIKIIPTGIAHGTLTLILKDKTLVEITSFRKDVQTDGRHAKVVFGKDIVQDAVRRDFTMNALYMDAQGQIFDFSTGLKDFPKKRLRFIGNAEERIKEDALRILRYFRFFGQTNQKSPNPEAFKACKKQKHLLASLSKERIYEEMHKILCLPNPLPTLHLMDKCGVLKQIIPQYDLRKIKILITKEKHCGFQTNFLFRIWLLSNLQLPKWVQKKAEKNEAENLKKAFELPIKSRLNEYRILYFYGREIFLNTLLYKKKLFFSSFRFYQSLTIPVCPFTAQDVANAFAVKGTLLGLKIKECENKWLDLNCPEKKEVVFHQISS